MHLNNNEPFILHGNNICWSCFVKVFDCKIDYNCDLLLISTFYVKETFIIWFLWSLLCRYLHSRVQWFFYFQNKTRTVEPNYLRTPNPNYDPLNLHFSICANPMKVWLFQVIFWAFEFPASNDIRGGGGTSLQGARALSAGRLPL